MSLVGSLLPSEVEALPSVQKDAVMKLRRGYLAGLVSEERLWRYHMLTPAQLAAELFTQREAA